MAGEDDPLSAALKMTFSGGGNGSFFPAARNVAANSDLLNQIDQTFYGGPAASPTPKPTPSPSPAKPTQMSLADLYNHFGVKQQVAATNGNAVRPTVSRSEQVFDWRHLYGGANYG